MYKKNEKAKDFLAILFYIITYILIYVSITKNNYIFASKIDFSIQHYVIPEYFRSLFYQTKNIFPDFAPNLGSGQNIYYLSYYGLLNPIIIISYFFPKITMLNYIIISSSITTIISTILFYFFLKKNNYTFKTRFTTTLLFLCAGPIIFHTKRHIMFINYIPFLIIGYYGIDKYLKNTNKILTISISITLLIFTSYFFSISSLVSLFIYYLYKFIKNNHKNFIKKTLKLSLPVIEGILNASLIIFPTLYCLLNGRANTINHLSLIDLIKPQNYLLYGSYSMGLTMITLIALIHTALHNKNKATKTLAIFILTISFLPFFNYILNGKLYINGKSLIPFIPLSLLITAEFLENIFSKNIRKVTILISIYIIVSSISVCLIINNNDKLMTKTEYNNKDNKTVNELIEYITQKDKTTYRINNLINNIEYINKINNNREYKTTLYSSTYNSNYKSFYYKTLHNNKKFRNNFMISSSDNILSQMILGEKYIITKNENKNLKLIKEKNGIKLYKNHNVLPIGYTTPNIISENNFNNLKYPTNIIELLDNIIVKKTKNNKNTINKLNIKKRNIDYQILEKTNLQLENYDNKFIIKAQKNAYLKLKLNTNTKDKLILIRFTNTYNPNKDLSITINNETNTLTSKNWKYNNKNYTFNYYLYNTDILDIYIKKGTYKITKLEAFIIDYSNIFKQNNIQEYKIDSNKTKENHIEGKITVKENGYFNISIPYDKGFNIKVDNNKINYEKTNKNFIGFPIKKGTRKITINYKAPFKKVSLLISILSIISLIITTKLYKSTNHK